MQGKLKSLLVLWSSCYLFTTFSSVLRNSPSHHSAQKPSRQDRRSLIIVRQLNHYFHLSAAFEVVVELWRIPAKSAQRYKTCTATDSAFLCLHLPALWDLTDLSQHHHREKFGSVLAGDPLSTAVLRLMFLFSFNS